MLTIDARKAIHGWTTVEKGVLDSNNNNNDDDITGSVQGSGAPVRAGEEGDVASRFALVDVDAAVTHPNDAVANDAQDKDDATLATIKDEATNTSSTDAVALDVAIIDGEGGLVGTEVFG